MPSGEVAKAWVKGKILAIYARALTIDFGSKTIEFVPKSVIHNEYQASDSELFQDLYIECWYLKRYNIEADC